MNRLTLFVISVLLGQVGIVVPLTLASNTADSPIIVSVKANAPLAHTPRSYIVRIHATPPAQAPSAFSSWASLGMVDRLATMGRSRQDAGSLTNGVAMVLDGGGRFPWHKDIVSTVFWIGEKATQNNPIPNDKSSWDSNWQQRYGGIDAPGRRRDCYAPASFTPGQNPFYVALPYNDIDRNGTKPEAALVIPWFRAAFQENGVSVCKGRWVAIRKGQRVCFAQWEDVGPFRTDHWQYVFGNERPSPNRNNGAGIDVSPAVQQFLGLSTTDVVDWRFVDIQEVTDGPWRYYGSNNLFADAASWTPSDGTHAKIVASSWYDNANGDSYTDSNNESLPDDSEEPPLPEW